MSPAIRPFSSLEVGEQGELTHRVTQEDLMAFAQLSGDTNPLHTDAAYASTTEYKTPIVHGMFLGALVSRLVGMVLPGMYSVLLKEELTFKQPVRVGDVVTVEGRITQKSEATRLIVLELVLTVEQAIVAEGRAHVRLLQ